MRKVRQSDFIIDVTKDKWWLDYYAHNKFDILQKNNKKRIDDGKNVSIKTLHKYNLFEYYLTKNATANAPAPAPLAEV